MISTMIWRRSEPARAGSSAAIGTAALLLAAMIATPLQRPPELPSISAGRRS